MVFSNTCNVAESGNITMSTLCSQFLCFRSKNSKLIKVEVSPEYIEIRKLDMKLDLSICFKALILILKLYALWSDPIYTLTYLSELCNYTKILFHWKFWLFSICSKSVHQFILSVFFEVILKYDLPLVQPGPAPLSSYLIYVTHSFDLLGKGGQVEEPIKLSNPTSEGIGSYQQHIQIIIKSSDL